MHASVGTLAPATAQRHPPPRATAAWDCRPPLPAGFQCSARQPMSAAVMAAPSLTQQRRLCACGASRKNRKGGGGGGKRGGCSEVNSSASDPASEAHRLQDAIRESRQQQLVAADMLAKLLQAEDPQEVAQQYTDSLDEQFFWQANTFLSMVGLTT